MSVKSTVHLTRYQAERKYVDLWLDKKRAKGYAKAAKMSREELEDKLERMNDEAHEGEGFENYLIDIETP